MVVAVALQPEAQVVLEWLSGEMALANSSDYVGLDLSEGIPRH